jgi:hypothetical protein
MANGNGNGNGNGKSGSNGTNGTNGAKTNSGTNSGGAGGGAQVQEGPVTIRPEESMGPVLAPSSNLGPALVTTGALALGGGLVYGFYRWRQKSIAGPTGAPLPSPGPTTPPAGPASPPAGPATPPAGPAQGAVDPNYWGTTKRGEEYRELLTKIEDVTRMPLRLILSVIANRESGWNRKARNKTAVETAASKRAIEAGPDRGNPPPKFAASLAGAGSGGLFGALAPYVAWTGLDEDFIPYLDADFTVVEDPIVAAICAAKYYQRVVANYPTVFANPSRPSAEDNYRVRLGWASPKTLKEDPAGSLFKSVKGRMDDDLAELGLFIDDLPPPSADAWPGLKTVFDAMQGFPVTWK